MYESNERCYMAEVLNSMYSYPQNIIFYFLKTVPGEIQLAIKVFVGFLTQNT